MLSRGAEFSGAMDIPVIERPAKIVIPDSLVPFSERKNVSGYNAAICFYENDKKFYDVFTSPERYVEEFRKYQAVISPDFSMYWDDPFTIQMNTLFLNRALGSYWQRRGVNVIPNVRWGSDKTYTQSVCREIPAFQGIEKHGIIAVGSYGCIKDREKRYHFEAGFEAMMMMLKPEVVLVYGAMPDYVFGAYEMYTKLVHYENFMKLRHERRCE